MTGSWQIVVPVIDLSVRQLCTRPYPNHKHGCPNWDKKAGCPPKTLAIDEIIDLGEPVYVIYNQYDFGRHVDRMKAKHPSWSDRQLACCLYWQGTARKHLREAIRAFSAPYWYLRIVSTPEAYGVDVTATMKNVGIELEWPPKRFAYQVVLAGSRKEGVNWRIPNYPNCHSPFEKLGDGTYNKGAKR